MSHTSRPNAPNTAIRVHIAVAEVAPDLFEVAETFRTFLFHWDVSL
jgi:hypothetical protein